MNAFDVVIGPRTRLAQALLADATNSPKRLLVARHERDRSALAKSNPGADVRLIDEITPTDLPNRVRVLICALGPVQGEDDPAPALHATSVERDLALIEAIVKRAPDAVTDLVYVSSVLALAPKPRPERAHYTAWKQVLESRLAGLGSTSLSVFYPGRLVDAASASVAHKAVHTTYAKLATTIATAPAGTREAIGRDARLWLLKRGIAAKSGIRPQTVSPVSKEISEALTDTGAQR